MVLKLPDKYFSLIGFTVTAILLTVIQPPYGLDFLAWVSMLGFIFACRPAANTKTLVIQSYIVSLCYWLLNLRFLINITWLGWLGACVYFATMWPLLAICIKLCRERKISLVLSCAILFTGAERLQGLLLGSFYWRFLSHSQYENLKLIQIADIFGAAGISFLIAMTTGLIAELILSWKEKKLFTIKNYFQTATVCFLLFAAVFYGNYRITQENCISQGPLVGSVQSNIPQTVKESNNSEFEIFEQLLTDSNSCIKAGASLVIYPETMVQAVLDPDVLAIVDTESTHKIFDKRLKQHALNRAYILAGATGGKPKFMPYGTINFEKRYNSAFLYTPQGRQDPKQYSKIHLLPFGEVIPFKKSFPPLHKLFMKFSPYDYDYSLDYGENYTIFEIYDNNKKYNFGTMICYEGTIPYITKNFTINKNSTKMVDWLVNISNDGWFVSFKGKEARASDELVQHNAAYVFRAVENRMPIIRSVNTGISCLVDSFGNIVDGYKAGNLPKKAELRQGIDGWFTDRMPIDSRVTFFSKHGQWLDFCCAVVFGVLVVMIIFEPFISKIRNKHGKKA